VANKKVLVTGADGFIGSHLAEELVRQGFQVRAFCYYNSFGRLGWLENSDREIMKSMEVVFSDIRDAGAVLNAVSGCEAVLHLAALISIPHSYHSPESYVQTNVQGTLNILEAAKRSNVSVIHTSTSEVYGTAQVVPITEDHPLVAQSPYSATKIAADQLALSYYRSFELPVTVVRPFNTYGPRQSNRAVIPTIISQIAQKKSSLSLGATSPTRDFNYVGDTVKGFIQALSAKSIVGETINLASNFEVSIGETAQAIKEIMGSNIEIQTQEERLRPDKSEVFRLFGDNQKAKRLLGYEPQHGGKEGFRNGLKKTIEWFSNPENLRHYDSNRLVL
jgi:NAD dependent epimerase/dehydratase